MRTLRSPSVRPAVAWSTVAWSTRPLVTWPAGFAIVRTFGRACTAISLFSSNHVPVTRLETVDLLPPSHRRFVGTHAVWLMKSLPHRFETVRWTRFSVHSQPLLQRWRRPVLGDFSNDIIAKRGWAIGSDCEGGEWKGHSEHQPPGDDQNLLQHGVFLRFAVAS